MKEAYRDQGTVPVVEHTIQDVRLALRQLGKNPGLAATAIVVLALGMGGCLDRVRLRRGGAAAAAALRRAGPAGRRDGDQPAVPALQPVLPGLPGLAGDEHASSAASTPTGSAATCWRRRAARVMVPGMQVSGGFFRTLGIRPILGRDFAAAESGGEGAKVTVITHRTWQERFGGDSEVVGRSITLSGASYTIIGVLPPTFQFAPGEGAEFWTPIDATGGCLARRSCHSLDGVGRLKPGVTIDEAGAAMAVIARAARTPVSGLEPRPGRRRRSVRRRHRRQHPADAVAAARRRGAAARHRLHQRGQPAAGADGVAPPRAVGAAGAGRVAGPDRPPLRDRGGRPRGDRRRCWRCSSPTPACA